MAALLVVSVFYGWSFVSVDLHCLRPRNFISVWDFLFHWLVSEVQGCSLFAWWVFNRLISLSSLTLPFFVCFVWISTKSLMGWFSGSKCCSFVQKRGFLDFFLLRVVFCTIWNACDNQQVGCLFSQWYSVCVNFVTLICLITVLPLGCAWFSFVSSLYVLHWHKIYELFSKHVVFECGCGVIYACT